MYLHSIIQCISYSCAGVQMYDEISSALEAAAKDTSVRVVVTTGTGDYYCSGNDLSNFMRISPTPENIKKSAEEAEIRLL